MTADFTVVSHQIQWAVLNMRHDSMFTVSYRSPIPLSFSLLTAKFSRNSNRKSCKNSTFICAFVCRKYFLVSVLMSNTSLDPISLPSNREKESNANEFKIRSVRICSQTEINIDVRVNVSTSNGFWGSQNGSNQMNVCQLHTFCVESGHRSTKFVQIEWNDCTSTENCFSFSLCATIIPRPRCKRTLTELINNIAQAITWKSVTTMAEALPTNANQLPKISLWPKQLLFLMHNMGLLILRRRHTYTWCIVHFEYYKPSSEIAHNLKSLTRSVHNDITSCVCALSSYALVFDINKIMSKCHFGPAATDKTDERTEFIWCCLCTDIASTRNDENVNYDILF